MIRWVLFTCLLNLAADSLATDRPPSASQLAALDVIFEDVILREAAGSIHRSAMQLAPAERFSMLIQQVLPDYRPVIRVQAGFLPVDDHRQGSTATMVSPVLDLVDTAALTQRLDELRKRVLTLPSPTGTEPNFSQPDAELNRQCLLTLIKLAANDPDSALIHLEQVERLIFGDIERTKSTHAEDTAADDTQATNVHSEPADALLLMLSRCVRVDSLREPTARLLTKYERWATALYEPRARERHWMALVHQARANDDGRVSGIKLHAATTAMTQWFPVSRLTAESHGTACPDSEWLFRRGHAELMSPHARDYLMFNIPLTGNFDVECDISLGGWKMSSVLIAGRWLGPVYTQNGFDSGAIRWQNPRKLFEPPLTRVREWMHYRATVRDGTVTTYFSGRPVQQRKFRHQVPWLGIRSNPRDRGMVQNLRITGQPGIPKQVDLLGDAGMGFWYPHFGESVGNIDDHWCIVDGILKGQTTSAELPHENDERLLTYHRPMLEDGEIRWEFLYQPEQTLAHPALDREVFLIRPEGIQLHHVTDGVWDQSGLAPDNITNPASHHQTAETLPLNVGQWNELQLQLTGNIITFRLNGSDVFTTELSSGNRRTFGLFHFADQTDVQVRNVIWKGDWPRSLPSIAEQELAVPDVTDDTDNQHLTAAFHHDFAKEGLPLNRFRIVRGNVGSHLVAGADGLTATREAAGGYLNATVSPQLNISGDFDVIAEYDQLTVSGDATGDGTIALIAALDNATNDEFFVARRHATRKGPFPEQIAQCATVQRFPEGERRSYFATEPAEETMGRLKLSRRADVLYYFTSENDATNFQLRGQRPIAADDISAGDLRLMTQMSDKVGRISVVWKNLTVRAETLSGMALGQDNRKITELNQQRDDLPQRSFHDFRTSAPNLRLIETWGDSTAWKSTDNGLQIRSTGAKYWTASGIRTLERLEGDFDLTVTFRPKHLATPRDGDYTQVYFQVEGSDVGQTQVNVVLTLSPNREFLAQARVRTAEDGGGFNYLGIAEAGITECNRLRLVRRQSHLTMLAGRSDQNDDIIVGRWKFNDLPIEPQQTRVMLHTGTEDDESQIVLESMDLRATRISRPNNATIPATTTPDNSPGTPNKSLLQSILDALR